MGIVDAFAGAAESLKTWENMLKSTTQAPFGEMTYEKYLSHLLSDHVPIYFDFKIKDPKSKTPTVHRILFANNASLLAKRKGMVDNSDAFGPNINEKQLEQWSKELVKPLIRGTVKLISDYKLELEAVEKWSGFQPLIIEAEKLLKESNMEKLYTVLKKLAKQPWGEPKALAEAQQNCQKARVMQEKAALEAERKAQQIKDEQQIKAILTSWKTDGGRLKQARKDLPTARNMVAYVTSGKSGLPCKFKKWSEWRKILKNFEDNGELGTPRRRMAQREFSSRRDSPVMTRLLEEIVRANQRHKELN